MNRMKPELPGELKNGDLQREAARAAREGDGVAIFRNAVAYFR